MPGGGEGSGFYFAEDTSVSDQSGNPISYYVDDLRDSWRNLRLYIFPRSIPPQHVDETDGATPESPGELDVLARTNEELRDRCINIVNRSEDLLTLRNEFIEVFGEVGKILKNAEGTSATLVQRSTMLELEEEEHGALKVRYRALHEENETHRGENSALRSEVQKYGELVSSRETRIEELETELIAEKDRAATLSSTVEQERFMANLASEKLQTALAETRSNEAQVATLQSDNAALNDRCSTSEFHARALQANLAQINSAAEGLREALAASQYRADGLAQGLGAAEIEIDNLRKRSEALDQALSIARMEHDMAQTLWQQRAKDSRDETVMLEAQVGAERSRADAAEQLLGEARAELHANIADLRAKELHLEELEAKIKPLSERGEEARKTIAEFESKASEDEKSRAKLADRAQALVRAMSDTKAKLESAEERADLLKERLANETERTAAEIEQLEQRIHGLTVQLEEERNARVVMAGALEAARTNVARRGSISTMHDILTRADEAEADQREYRWPWAAKDAPPTLEFTSTVSGAPAPEMGQSLNSADAPTKSDRMPRVRPLVVRRDRQRSDSRQ
jgi:chromosome segregation ATPase